MKKVYMMAALTLMALSTYAQSTSAVSGCIKASGEINIFFDLSKVCTFAPANSADSLGKRTEIGFHSGVNGWTNVREWNHATNVHAFRTSGTGTTSVFQVTLADPTAYYGLAAAPNVVNFVFNDGAQGLAATPNFPWYAEGKDQGPAACVDFALTVSELTTCATSNQELRDQMSVSVAPNPFTTVAVLSFDNPASSSFSMQIVNLTGQVVRTYSDITSGSVEINRGTLANGIYFAVLQDAKGHFLTEKIVIE